MCWLLIWIHLRQVIKYMDRTDILLLAAWIGNINFVKIQGQIQTLKLFLWIIHVHNQMVHVLHHLQIIHCLDPCQKLEFFLRWVHMGSVFHVFSKLLKFVFCSYVNFLFFSNFFLLSPSNLQELQFQLLLLGGCQIHLLLLILQFLVELLVLVVHPCQVSFKLSISNALCSLPIRLHISSWLPC